MICRGSRRASYVSEVQAMPTFVDLSLIDKIRKARLDGVSMDVVPLMHAYDDDPDNPQFDPEAEIRFSRMDNVARNMELAAQKALSRKEAREQAKSASTDIGSNEPASAPSAPASTLTE